MYFTMHENKRCKERRRSETIQQVNTFQTIWWSCVKHHINSVPRAYTADRPSRSTTTHSRSTYHETRQRNKQEDTDTSSDSTGFVQPEWCWVKRRPKQNASVVGSNMHDIFLTATTPSIHFPVCTGRNEEKRKTVSKMNMTDATSYHTHGQTRRYDATQ